MGEEYPIIRIEPDWVGQPEEMGSKQKFWYRHPGAHEPAWLFKIPRPGTGEHWAEKLAEQVAAALEIPHARVELAEFNGVAGSTTESFTVGGHSLLHGNQVLEAHDTRYDPARRYGQSRHTLARILQALETVCPSPEAADRAKARIAEYLVLDALIGNTDRHHENWGLLQRQDRAPPHMTVAPSYDHASSFGRELRDDRRERYLEEGQVAWYVARGRGAVYWTEEEPHGPSPLELVRRAARSYPDLFLPALDRLRGIDDAMVARLIARVPAAWMTVVARKFAQELASYVLRELRSLER